VATTDSSIVNWCERLLEDRSEYERMAKVGNPIGDGKVSHRIADILLGKPDGMGLFRPQEVLWRASATC
jgi:UDP-N-acetylglucosamine 2-epimerase